MMYKRPLSRFRVDTSLERIEVVPPALVCTVLGILHFLGLLFGVCEASEED